MNYDVRPIGFWSALIGTCRGVALFPALVKNSWLRVVWHWIVMILICSAAIAWGEYRQIRPVINAGELAFTETFGEHLFNSETGMRPEREPARARQLPLPQNGMLYYTGDEPVGPVLAGDELEKLGYFLIWAPGGLLMSFRVENGGWLTSKWQHSATEMMSAGFGVPLDDQSMAALASELPSARQWFVGRNVEATATLFDSLRSAMGLCLFLGNVLILSALALFVTALFSLMYRLFGARRMRHLRVSDYWKIGIYSSFPVMLVAGCFPALALPFLNYGTVYVFGLAVYWMIAANSVEAAAERNSDEHGQE